MRFSTPQTLENLATLIGARYVGDPFQKVLGTNEIHRVEAGEIVFVNHHKYYDKALNSKATVILIDKEVECPSGKGLLISADPFGDFNRINLHFGALSQFKSPAENTSVGENTFIHPSVVLGRDVEIGSNCYIGPGSVIGDKTRIGNHVVIQSATIIGGDAFYYRKTPQRYERLESVGDVVIEDYVEIGNACTIDRGVTASTIIGEGSVLDNQIQLGHDTVVGRRVLIAAQTGIAGCCNIGDDVTIWGQVGMASGVTIEAGTVLLAKTGAHRSLKKGTYFGQLAREFKAYLRDEIKVKNLP